MNTVAPLKLGDASSKPGRPSAFRQAMRRALAITVPRRLFLTQGHPKCRSVSITFDDGPHPEHTPRVLDVLAGLGVPATFFIIGNHARLYPDLVRRIATEGHEIGNHTLTHSPPQSTPAGKLLAEVVETDQLIADLSGRRPRLFRPPHGKLTAGKLCRLWLSGHRVVLWNSDPKDFECASRQELFDRVDGLPIAGGDILLFHDNKPYAADVLPRIVADGQRAGLRFTTISNMGARDTANRAVVGGLRA